MIGTITSDTYWVTGFNIRLRIGSVRFSYRSLTTCILFLTTVNLWLRQWVLITWLSNKSKSGIISPDIHPSICGFTLFFRTRRNRFGRLMPEIKQFQIYMCLSLKRPFGNFKITQTIRNKNILISRYKLSKVLKERSVTLCKGPLYEQHLHFPLRSAEVLDLLTQIAH